MCIYIVNFISRLNAAEPQCIFKALYFGVCYSVKQGGKSKLKSSIKENNTYLCVCLSVFKIFSHLFFSSSRLPILIPQLPHAIDNVVYNCS